MGTTTISRALTFTGVLLLWACQPSPAPEQTDAPAPSSPGMDESPEHSTVENKSHNKQSNRDVSALKLPNQSIDVSKQTCTATAYTTSGNAAGILVHQEPSRDAPVIGTVSAQEPVVVTVTGAQSPWLYITPNPDDAEGLATPGWIQNNLLAIQVRSADTSRPDGMAPLQVAPDVAAAPTSEVVTGTEVLVTGCSGDWLRVKSSEADAGWLAPEHQCSNPFSTCP